MDELLDFIDAHFIDLGGEMFEADVVTMNDLKILEKLVKTAIKSKESKRMKMLPKRF
jgi:hypothetical protein